MEKEMKGDHCGGKLKELQNKMKKDMLRESVMCLAALRKKIEAAGGGSDQVAVEECVAVELLLEKKAVAVQSEHAGAFVVWQEGQYCSSRG